MGFDSTVDGLTRLSPQLYDGTSSSNRTVHFDAVTSTATTACAGFGDLIFTCPMNDVLPVSSSIGLGSIPFNVSADYFAVLVYINGPLVLGRGCGSSVSPTDSPCKGALCSYDGTVDGDYVIRDSDEPSEWRAVASTYDAVTGSPVQAPGCKTEWPNPPGVDASALSSVAYLLNPAPVWPIPDGDGNEFGMCLFELAQLPAAIETSITEFAHHATLNGFWRVTVSAYVLGEEPPLEHTGGICIVGSA